MLTNNKYYYTDKYMYFSFDGVHSSKYNLFIENNNNLTIENNIGQSSEFVSAMFQEGNYYMGTKRTQKTFKRKCAAEGLTLSQYKAMIKWLSVGKTGMLIFDSNPYWGWTVVLDTVGDATFVGDTSNLIVQFELTFKTIGTYLARNAYQAYCDMSEVDIEVDSTMSTCNGYYNTTMSSNEYGIPVIYYEYNKELNQVRNNLYCVQSVNNMHQHLNFSYVANKDASTSLKIVNDGIEYVDLATYASGTEFVINYLGESNLILADDEIIELKNDLLNYNYQPNGILQLSSEQPKLLSSVIVESGQIFLDKNEIDDLLLNGYNYICFTKHKNGIAYGEANWNGDTYPTKYETYLFFISSETKNLNANLANVIETQLDYGNFLLNSMWTIYSDDYELPHTTLTIGEGNSSIVSFQTILNNSLLEDNSIDWKSFTCYMGKSNFVNIICNNTGDKPDAAQHKQKFLTVVSCNNL